MKKLFEQLPLRQFPELDSLRFLSIFLALMPASAEGLSRAGTGRVLSPLS